MAVVLAHDGGKISKRVIVHLCKLKLRRFHGAVGRYNGWGCFRFVLAHAFSEISSSPASGCTSVKVSDSHTILAICAHRTTASEVYRQCGHTGETISMAKRNHG